MRLHVASRNQVCLRMLFPRLQQTATVCFRRPSATCAWTVSSACSRRHHSHYFASFGIKGTCRPSHAFKNFLRAETELHSLALKPYEVSWAETALQNLATPRTALGAASGQWMVAKLESRYGALIYKDQGSWLVIHDSPQPKMPQLAPAEEGCTILVAVSLYLGPSLLVLLWQSRTPCSAGGCQSRILILYCTCPVCFGKPSWGKKGRSHHTPCPLLWGGRSSSSSTSCCVAGCTHQGGSLSFSTTSTQPCHCTWEEFWSIHSSVIREKK